jgi:hypothetical protein
MFRGRPSVARQAASHPESPMALRTSSRR